MAALHGGGIDTSEEGLRGEKKRFTGLKSTSSRTIPRCRSQAKNSVKAPLCIPTLPKIAEHSQRHGSSYFNFTFELLAASRPSSIGWI
jgi:hypothetical protein